MGFVNSSSELCKRLNGYLPIENYGIIGNLRTVALVGLDASIDFFCYPTFDSPSIFCRLLDKNIGGHYQIAPTSPVSIKQRYLPNSNILVTQFLGESGVGQVTDFMPVCSVKQKDIRPSNFPFHNLENQMKMSQQNHFPWLIRILEVTEGKCTFRVECFPSFNYSKSPHETRIQPYETNWNLNSRVGNQSASDPAPDPYFYYLTDSSNSFHGRNSVQFLSDENCLDLRYLVASHDDSQKPMIPEIKFRIVTLPGMKGPGVVGEVEVSEGQQIWFILRMQSRSSADSYTTHVLEKNDLNILPEVEVPEELPDGNNLNDGASEYLISNYPNPPFRGDLLDQAYLGPTSSVQMDARLQNLKTLCFRWKKATIDPPLSLKFMQDLLHNALKFWHDWINKSTYKGRFREMVLRSALVLKLLTFEPTGAIVAAPTFSLPELIGGTRNWDYRYVWIRDSAFTIYALLRLGLLEEAKNYMKFLQNLFDTMGPDGSLKVMYTIQGSSDIPELELNHLEGYRESRPVRIGNGAAAHKQLDIYGALLDAIYLMNKFASPIGYDMWRSCQKLINYVCREWNQPDMSIWEVRGGMQNFTYSKVMCWVAVDRGLRLSEKRVFPCPDRELWLKTRDEICKQVMTESWDPSAQYFVQSFEKKVLDSSVLIMPMTFFISPTDPRILSTIRAIMKPLGKGGLTTSNLVYRYNTSIVDDGLNTSEGSFNMCTFWMIECLTRAGRYDGRYLCKALYMFEQIIAYSNHLSLFSEELSKSAEHLGNFPQAFTHIALISSAFNLDRIMDAKSLDTNT